MLSRDIEDFMFIVGIFKGHVDHPRHFRSYLYGEKNGTGEHVGK